MNCTRSIAIAAVTASALCAGTSGSAVAQGHSNPTDRVSNPSAREFSTVEVGLPDFQPPFVRDGVLAEPSRLALPQRKMTQAQVKSALGDPPRMTGPQDREWNYNFKFKLPESINHIVCEVKVVFDAQGMVDGVVWRRSQCEQLATQKTTH
jgi:outer membrane protein assembly factor BamE (lipoprotein component of BamABCDE complex)